MNRSAMSGSQSARLASLLNPSTHRQDSSRLEPGAGKQAKISKMSAILMRSIPPKVNTGAALQTQEIEHVNPL